MYFESHARAKLVSSVRGRNIYMYMRITCTFSILQLLNCVNLFCVVDTACIYNIYVDVCVYPVMLSLLFSDRTWPLSA